MKIYITQKDDSRPGYKTISPSQGQLLTNLSNVVDDNECIEILAPDIINYIPFHKLQETITHFVSKLRHGGKLVLGGYDLYEVSKLIIRGSVDSDAANQILFGTQQTTWDVQRSQINMKDLVDLFEYLNLKITRKALDGINMLVEGIRE